MNEGSKRSGERKGTNEKRIVAKKERKEGSQRVKEGNQRN